MIINLLQDFLTFQVNVLTNVAKQRSWWGWGHSARLNRADTSSVWSQCPLSLTKNLPHSKFYLHQMAISLSSLSRQEKRWLLRRSTENQATIKTEHAKTPSHLHSTTGRFNFQGMQNVIDLINSDNKTSADSHVLCIRPQASLWQGWEAGATLQCHWCCYLCQSPVPGSHSCIQTSDWSAIIRCQPPLLSTSQRITALVWAVN